MLLYKEQYFFIAVSIFLFSSISHAIPHEFAVLQTLDKVTARVSTVQVNIGEILNLGTLKIKVHACDKRPPEEIPESAVFLNIWEGQYTDDSVNIFSGWMFASSPGLNALEHPVYDVWVINCKNPIKKLE